MAASGMRNSECTGAFFRSDAGRLSGHDTEQPYAGADQTPLVGDTPVEHWFADA